MCEVTSDNFESLLPEIMENISNASFVAFDCEFTALCPDSRIEMKNSLFDSIETRYKKMTRPAMESIISQLGLAVFQHQSHSNSGSYEVRSYNFYICPKSFGSIDSRFVCQASSIEFLTRYEFDFNKCFYLGVPYLSRNQEIRMKTDLNDGVMFRAIDRNLPLQDEERLREICAELAIWSSKSCEGEVMGPLHLGLLLPFIVHVEVRKKFPNLWSFDHEDGIIIGKVSADRRAQLEAEEDYKQLEGKLLNSLLGFTKVFRHLSESGKPLVGHNCLLDILRMFQQFEDKLPSTYQGFKREIHQMFPHIFDTKHICFSLRNKIKKQNLNLERLLVSSNLNQLQKVLSQRRDQPHVPRLIHPQGFTRYQGQEVPHEAGYDALLAGSCFLNLSYLAASLEHPQQRPLSFRETLLAVAEHENMVNIARAAVSYVHLAGKDPELTRPAWLHLSSNTGSRLNCTSVAEILARWGTVDVRPSSSGCVLVAVGNHRTAREIMEHFTGDRELLVVRYSALSHNSLVRTALWTTGVLSLTLGLSLLHRQLSLRL